MRLAVVAATAVQAGPAIDYYWAVRLRDGQGNTVESAWRKKTLARCGTRLRGPRRFVPTTALAVRAAYLREYGPIREDVLIPARDSSGLGFEATRPSAPFHGSFDGRQSR
jgi:hypothetical protein